MSAVSHVKTNTIGDFANTVTVFNSQGSTTTAAATDLVRPGDWNSAHNFYQTISSVGGTAGGKTFGTSTMSGTNLVLGAQDGMVLSNSTAAGAATVWIGQERERYYANLPVIGATSTMQPLQSTSMVAPFMLQFPLTANFVRMFQSGSVLAASTTGTTTGNTSWSAGATKSHVFHILSRGTGASSQSLITVTTTQIQEFYSQQWSVAAGISSQFSVSQRYSMPCSTGTTGFTKDYSTSVTRLDFHSSQITDLTGLKQIDYYFPMTLQPGLYWLMYGASTTSNSNFTSIGLRDIVSYNIYGMSQAQVSFGVLGSASQSSVAWQPGQGSYTTNSTSVSGLGLVNVSSSSGNMLPYFQLMAID